MKFSLLVNVPVFGTCTKNIHKRDVKDPRMTKDPELQSVELTWIVALIRTINKLASLGNNACIYAPACSATSIPLEAVTTDQGRFITVNIDIADQFPSLAAECLGVKAACVNPPIECTHNDIKVSPHPTTRAHDNFMEKAISATFQKIDGVDLRMLHKSINDVATSQMAWIMDDLSRMVMSCSSSGRRLYPEVFYVVRNGQPSFSKGVLKSIYERTIKFKHQTEHAPPPHAPPPPPPPPLPSLYESSASSNSDLDENYNSSTVCGQQQQQQLKADTNRTTRVASIIEDAKTDAEAIVRLRSSCHKLARVKFPLVTPLASGVEWHTHAKAYHSIWDSEEERERRRREEAKCACVQ